MLRIKVLGLLALGFALASGLGGSDVVAQQGIQQSQLERESASAAAEYGVPEELLLAMGYVNTRWETPPESSRDGGYGLMHLVDNPSSDTLGEASRLTGTSEAQLMSSRYENIRGGAALLANAHEAGSSQELGSWYDAVAEVGGGQLYANQVFGTLNSGPSATISTGESISLQSQSGAAPQELFSPQASPGYPGSIWYPAATGNYTPANRPASNEIDKIVVHVTQGSWASALTWFQNPAAGVSANYTIRSSDGAVGQSVSEQNISYHAGNWPYNQSSVGIEHEGFVNDPKWFTDEMYRSSARVAAHLVNKYDIPVDRQHIVGHYDVPGATHTDPGPYWNWDLYMSYVRQYAGTGAGSGDAGGDGGGGPVGDGGGDGASYSAVVDNADGSTSGRFKASGNWRWTAWNQERHYWNYRFARPEATGDTARYEFDLPARDNYEVYAWWPSDKGYNSQTPIGVKTATGWEWQYVDQSRNGGRWVSLGSHQMEPGYGPRVQVSRWTAGEGLVIADAFKVVRR